MQLANRNKIKEQVLEMLINNTKRSVICNKLGVSNSFITKILKE